MLVTRLASVKNLVNGPRFAHFISCIRSYQLKHLPIQTLSPNTWLYECFFSILFSPAVIDNIMYSTEVHDMERASCPCLQSCNLYFIVSVELLTCKLHRRGVCHPN